MSREPRDEGENQPRYPRVKLSHVFEQPIPESVMVVVVMRERLSLWKSISSSSIVNSSVSNTSPGERVLSLLLLFLIFSIVETDYDKLLTNVFFVFFVSFEIYFRN